MTCDFDLGLAGPNAVPSGPVRASKSDDPRARRRIGTILLVYLIHFVLGLALAWPLSGVLTTGTQRLPGGDALLFDPGGLYLLEAIRRNGLALDGAAPGSLWLLLSAGYFGLIPMGSLLHALDHGGKLRLVDLAMAGARRFGQFSFLLGMTTLTAVLCLLPIGILGWLFWSGTRTPLSVVGITVLGGICVMLLRIAQDLARSALVRRDLPLWDAMDLTWRVLVGMPLRVAYGWLWRSVGSIAFVVCGALLCRHLSLTTPTAFATVFLVHQLVVFAILCLRASWIACLLRLVDRLEPTSRERLDKA